MCVYVRSMYGCVTYCYVQETLLVIGKIVFCLDHDINTICNMLSCRNRIRIFNVLEVFLCFFNEGSSVLVYTFILTLPLVILSGFKA